MQISAYLPFMLAVGLGTIWLIVCCARIFLISDSQVLGAQVYQQRLPFEGAWQLQQATDRAHRTALLGKIIYQAIGIFLVTLPPLTIMRGALTSSSQHADADVLVMEFLGITVFTLTVLGWKKPTHIWVRARLRAESLRLHTHFCLALLPPYDDGQELRTALSSIQRLKQASIVACVSELKTLVRLLERGDSPTAPIVDRPRADAYDRERIEEQLRYFPRATKNLHRMVRITGTLFKIGLVAATLTAGARLLCSLVHCPIPMSLFELILRACVVLVALAMTMRAVFGWESRIAVYRRQCEELTDMRNERDRLHSAHWGATDDQEWQRDFRSLARRLEESMVREAQQWDMVVERELFEAPL